MHAKFAAFFMIFKMMEAVSVVVVESSHKKISCMVITVALLKINPCSFTITNLIISMHFKINGHPIELLLCVWFQNLHFLPFMHDSDPTWSLAKTCKFYDDFLFLLSLHTEKGL